MGFVKYQQLNWEEQLVEMVFGCCRFVAWEGGK
jgi:hypothetical protein